MHLRKYKYFFQITNQTAGDDLRSALKVGRICSANGIFILDSHEHQAGILGASAARRTFRSYMASTMRVLMSSPKAFSSEQINVGFILPLKG